jgi:tol-pal system protein YbgF
VKIAGDAERRLPPLFVWGGASVSAAPTLPLRLPVPGLSLSVWNPPSLWDNHKHLKQVPKPEAVQEIPMKSNRVPLFFVVLAVLTLGVTPAGSASKEMIQLQTQVQQLQEQMTAMQRSFDERMGVMKNLVETDTDAVNKVTAALTGLNATLSKQQGDVGTKTDQLSGQIQSLNDTMDEIKARMAKVSKQLEDMQGAQQSLAAQQATQQAAQQAVAAAPPPDVLYNNALRDYNGAKNDLATQEFSDYIKFYPNTDLAGNSYFYLGEIQFRQANYQQAAQSYDQVVQNFPSGNKAASAELKKGFSLIELGKQDDGVSELRHVIQRFPRSPEALQARDRLHKLGVPTTGK